MELRTLLSFVPGSSYATGPSPTALTSADFNGDGRLDLAVANSGNDSVRVLIGNPGGTFDVGGSFATGSAPAWIGTGDFDGDDKADLFTADSGAPDLANRGFSVLRGNGDGSFRAAQHSYVNSPLYATPFGVLDSGRPSDAVLHDFNADGNLDAIVVLTGIPDQDFSDYGYYFEGRLAELQVFLGNGDGTFTAGVTGEIYGYTSPSIEMGDLDGNGKMDLILGASTARANVRLGNGDGTFQPPTLVDQVQWSGALKAGDFDDDGNVDLAAADWLGVTVALGTGDGTFGTTRSFSEGMHRKLDAADFDGDGTLDLASVHDARDGTYTIHAFLGRGDGDFQTARTYPVDGVTTGFLAVDVGPGGLPDMVTADATAGGVRVLDNTGDWRTFSVDAAPAEIRGGVPFAITFTARDANGDPITDYTGTVRLTSSDPLAILPKEYTFTAANAGKKTFEVTLNTPWTPHTITVTDVNTPGFQGQASGLRSSPGAPSRFQFYYYASAEQTTAGQWDSFQVQALDAFGFPTAYPTGTLGFTSSDPLASLPGDTFVWESELDYTYFSVSFGTAGYQMLTVHDVANPSLRGTLGPIRVVPAATVDAPFAALRDRPITVTLGASGVPAGTPLSFAIDWEGDGQVDQTVVGPAGTKVSRSFTTSRVYRITVIATVQIGGQAFASNPVHDDVYISAATVGIRTDPADVSKKALFVEGTDEWETIAVGPAAANGVEVFLYDNSVGVFADPSGAAFGRVYVYGNAGGDYLVAQPGMVVLTYLFGGDGDDELIATGTTANNVLIGGAGADSIQGGSGRNMLIGGADSDLIIGGGGEDILISGTTSYDANVTALAALMREWGRTDSSYATRVKRLNGSLSGGLNGSYRLTSRTVFDDAAIDTLVGNGSLDWFLRKSSGRKKDVIRDLASSEVVTAL